MSSKRYEWLVRGFQTEADMDWGIETQRWICRTRREVEAIKRARPDWEGFMVRRQPVEPSYGFDDGLDQWFETVEHELGFAGR